MHQQVVENIGLRIAYKQVMSCEVLIAALSQSR